LGCTLPVCASDPQALRSLVFPSVPTRSGATQTVTPSCGFAPLQGVLPKVSPVTSRCGHLLQGFPCRLAHRFRRSPHTPEAPTLRVKGRIQGLSPSFRSAPPPALRVCFAPLTLFGFTLQGFPLPRSRADSSPAPCRLAVLHRLASRSLGRGTAGAHPHIPRSGASAFCRLHGFAPLESPFRAAPRLGKRRRPCPSWAMSSPGSALPSRCGDSSPPLLPCA